MTRSRLLSRPAFLLTCVQSAAAFTAGGLEAQTAAHIPSELACPRCSIRVESVLTIGRDDDRLGSRAYGVRRDSRGRYFVVTPETSRSIPLVFDARGRYVREIGREGAGPNEFRAAIALEVARGDTIYVFDRANARLSVLDPDLREVRTIPIPPSTNTAAVLPTGTAVLNAAVWDTDRVGHPYHRIDATGSSGYFGADPNEPLRPGDVSGAVRWMTPARGSQFWSLRHAHRYSLELWDADGTLHKRYTRTADWFAEYDRSTTLAPGNPPQSRGMGVWFDQRTGLVWTIVHVADPRWRDGVGPVRRAEGGEYLPVHDRQRVYDAIVEVIDVDAGRVLARQRFDHTIDIPIGAGLFAGARETPYGEPYLEVWRLVLVVP